MYTEQQKERALAYARTHNSRAAGKKFGISEFTIRRWKKNGHAPVVQTVEYDVNRQLADENTRLKKYLFENVFLPTILKS